MRAQMEVVPQVSDRVPIRSRRRTVGLVLVIVAAVAIALVSYPRFVVPDVEVVAAGPREVVRTLVVTGRVRPAVRVQLGTSAAGVVQEVAVREGDTVAAGAFLARLDEREAAALLAQAEARLLEARAGARDEVARAERELEQAQLDAGRLRSVFPEGGLALQRLEEAERRASDAESRLRALRAGGEEDGVTARVQEAEAAAEAARARYSAHVLTAPFDGIVLARLAEPGDAVVVGRGLVDFAAVEGTELVAFPSEENLAGLSVGTRARVSADAYPDDSFEAGVTLVAPSVDADQGTVEIRLSADHPVPYLRPGMTVSVNLSVGRRSADAVLPVGAVRGLTTSDPWLAVVVDGRIERRPVSLGSRGDSLVEILTGLEAGEQVVRAADQVEPGDRVRPSPSG
jgi:HlyD family secretion protein